MFDRNHFMPIDARIAGDQSISVARCYNVTSPGSAEGVNIPSRLHINGTEKICECGMLATFAEHCVIGGAALELAPSKDVAEAPSASPSTATSDRDLAGGLRGLARKLGITMSPRSLSPMRREKCRLWVLAV